VTEFYLTHNFGFSIIRSSISVFVSTNWRGIFMAKLLVLLSLCFLGDKIKNFMFQHPPALYFFLAIVLFTLIEIIATFRAGRKERKG